MGVGDENNAYADGKDADVDGKDADVDGPPGPRVSSHYSHRPPVSQGSVTLVKRIASWK